METPRRTRPSRTRLLVTTLCGVALSATACAPGASRSGTLIGSDTTSPASIPVATDAAASTVAPSTTVPGPATSAPTPTTQRPAPDTSAEPTTTTEPLPWNATGSPALGTPGDPADCPGGRRSAVVYRKLQRGVLCENNTITLVFAVTTHRRVPDEGYYRVLSKNLNVTSTVGGHISKMRHFTAFTPVSPRIAFHSVPKDLQGNYVQPLDSVGSPEVFGASAGCIRVLPEVAEYIYGFLRRGDRVRIIG